MISNEAVVMALKAWRGTPIEGDALTNALEAAAPIIRAEALEEFAAFILRPKYEGLDAYTLEEAAKEARARAAAERGEV